MTNTPSEPKSPNKSPVRVDNRKPRSCNLPDYLSYYKSTLNLSGDDYTANSNILTEKLPYTLRITNTIHSERIKKQLDEKYSEICKRVEYIEGVYVFYKRRQLQNINSGINSELPEELSVLYDEFNDFITNAAEIGLIQRQEIVSMLPVLLMGLKPNMAVFEPCAAPGSKTKQILEILSGSGVLVSNDMSAKRTNILVTEAMKQNTTPLIVTNVNALSFPCKNSAPVFDRISCDVPCSGDGTIRKNPNVTDRWTIRNTNAQLRVQSNILRRSLDMLKPGGVCVYSTCSLNVLEDEWIVAETLRKDPSIEIQAHNQPWIHSIPNNSTFNINSTDNINSTGNIKNKLVVREGISQFKQTIGDKEYEWDNSELSKCIRVYPQDNNTGGFFLAILHKKGCTENNSEGIKGIKNESVIGDIKESSARESNNSTVRDFSPNKDVSDKFIQPLPHDSMHRLISLGDTQHKVYMINRQVHEFMHSNSRIVPVISGIKAYQRTKAIGEVDGHSHYYAPKSTFLLNYEQRECIEIEEREFQVLISTKCTGSPCGTENCDGKCTASQSVDKSALPSLCSTWGYCLVQWNTIRMFVFCSNDKVVPFLNKFAKRALEILYQ